MSSSLERVRSVLFLPASNPRAIGHARESAADLVILDLEDAVKPEDKDSARSAAVDAVAEKWPMPVAIRVNGIGTQWHSADVDSAARSKADYAVLPRATSGRLVHEVAKAAGKPLLAMVETAAGVLAAADIAAESAALIAGTNDLRAELRVPTGENRAAISASLQLILLGARSAGIPAFDGVFNDLENRAGFTGECAEGRALGFDGKSLIHPRQIEPCNRAFSPTEDELARARRLVEAFSGGAERFEGQMIERMHVETAQHLLDRS